MNFKEIKNENLDSIDLSELSMLINSIEHRNYFTSKSSLEHYRLLSYISLMNDNSIFLDIGTFKGCSALAFSINPSNEVYTFDLGNNLDLKSYPKNIHGFIDDITDPCYLDVVWESKYILLDTMHDGTFENVFFNYLKQIDYKGFLMLDDIKLNNEMINFWNNIDLEKDDISNIGHITGTGVVYFK